MNNVIMLVGRLVQDPEIKELENGKKVCNITLAIPRYYKNDDGIYETDFIPAGLFGQIANTTTEYCKKGDLIGIKGYVTRLGGEDLKIEVERVTFLSSRKENE